MAKTDSSDKAVRTTPQHKGHSYISALVSDDCGRLSTLTTSTANGFARKKLDAASQRLQLRAERNAQQTADKRAYVVAAHGLRIEFMEGERRRRALHRLLQTKIRPEKVRHQPSPERERTWLYASRALPKYGTPVIDRKGARGVFVRIRYYSRRTAKAGVSYRVVKYVFDGAEVNAEGRPYFVSNVGRNIDEALCAFDHLEQVNWAAQKNAKLMMHAIMAADHRQTPDDMMRTGLIWAEEALGRFGLPYVVTLHAPPPEGDLRNWHLHILFSFRPTERVGDHTWHVSEMLRTDLDNPQAMQDMREKYASAMTVTSFQAGINQPYTAKSNAARGLLHEPQQHLGGVRTSMARNGYHIARNEENFERVLRSEAAVLDEELRHVDETLAREQEMVRSVGRRWTRTPSVLSQVPRRIMTAFIDIDVPPIARPASPVEEPMVIPVELPARSEVAPVPEHTETPVEPHRMAPAGVASVKIAPIPARPMQPSVMASLEIANLRLSAAPVAPSSIPLFQGCDPVDLAKADFPPLPPAPAMAIPGPLADAGSITSAAPSAPSYAIVPPVSAVPLMAERKAIVVFSNLPVPFIAITVPLKTLPPTVQPVRRMDKGFDSLLSQNDQSLHREDMRARREQDEPLELARQHAEKQRLADEHSRAQASARLEQLYAALRAERVFLVSEDGDRRLVPKPVLDRFQLPVTEVNGAAVQKRLTAIAQTQVDELAPLISYISKSPECLVRRANSWALPVDAPPDAVQIAALWRHDQNIQTMLGQLVKDCLGAAPARAVGGACAERITDHPVPSPSRSDGAPARRSLPMAQSDAHIETEAVASRTTVASRALIHAEQLRKSYMDGWNASRPPRDVAPKEPERAVPVTERKPDHPVSRPHPSRWRDSFGR